MRVKFIKSFNAISSSALRETVDIPIGRYGFLLVRISGTSDTGQDLDPSEVGTISLMRQGRQLQRETFEFYFDYSDLKGGFPQDTSPTAGATVLNAYIPLMLPGVPNSLDVRTKDEVDLNFEFLAALDTAMSACTCAVYGVETPAVPEAYELHVFKHDLQVSAAKVETDSIPGPNIAALYLKDASSVVDRVQIKVDGEVAIDNIDDTVLLELTRFLNRVESSVGDVAEVNLALSGFVQEAINSDVDIQVNFTGSGTLTITVFRAVFRESDAAGSVARANQYLASKRSFDNPFAVA